MSTPGQHISFQQREFYELSEQLASFKKWGVLETDPGYQRLWKARGAAWGKIGKLKARTTTLATAMVGFSPGLLRLWSDAELGWMVEARVSSEAPPIYKYVKDDIAEAIVKREVTHDQFEELMTPDNYYGE